MCHLFGQFDKSLGTKKIPDNEIPEDGQHDKSFIDDTEIMSE